MRLLVCLYKLCSYFEISFWRILDISTTLSSKCCFTVSDGVKNEKSSCKSVIQDCYGGPAAACHVTFLIVKVVVAHYFDCVDASSNVKQ